MEHYSALKKNKILTHTATCVKLEDVILNEISQTQKGTYMRYLGKLNTQRQNVEQ